MKPETKIILVFSFVQQTVLYFESDISKYVVERKFKKQGLIQAVLNIKLSSAPFSVYPDSIFKIYIKSKVKAIPVFGAFD